MKQRTISRLIALFLILLLLVIPNITGVFGSTDQEEADQTAAPETVAALLETLAAATTQAETEAPVSDAAPQTEPPAVPASDSVLRGNSGETTEPSTAPSAETEPVFDLAALSGGELYAYLRTLSEEEQVKTAEQLTEAQIQSVFDYLHEQGLDRGSMELPETKTFTDAGPFLQPVDVSGSTRRSPAKGASGSVDNPNLFTNRAVIPNDDGSFLVRTEAWATGNSFVLSYIQPVDIVLVLDHSLAMDSNMGSVKRLAAMKTSVKNFIDDIQTDFYDDFTSDHRIAVVTFGNSAEVAKGWTEVNASGAAQLKQLVDGLTVDTDYNPKTELAIDLAENLITGSGYSYDGNNTRRQKVVILFTASVPYAPGSLYSDEDGSRTTAFATTASSGASIFTVEKDLRPSETRSNTLNYKRPDAANSILTKAQRIKNQGVALYTIGVFNSANKNAIYGTTFYRWGGFFNISCESNGGEATTFWGYTGSNTQKPVDGFGTLDTWVMNRFLHYMSSNTSKSSLDLAYIHDQHRPYSYLCDISGLPASFLSNESSHAWSYYILEDTVPAPSTDSYYLTASDSAGLEGVFQEITGDFSSSGVTLDQNSTLREDVSPYFDISDVKVSYRAAEGNSFVGGEIPYTSGVTATVSGSQIQVTGFNYSDYYIAYARLSGGRKIILTYKLTPKAGFLGGDEVPVVSGAGLTSGIYDRDGMLYENLGEDKVSVPLAEPTVQAGLAKVYMDQDYTQGDYLSLANAALGGVAISDPADPLAQFADWQKEFVDVSLTVALPTASSYADQDGVYTLKLKIQSKKDSSNAKEAIDNGIVHVYTPSFDLKDSEVRYGQAFDLNRDLAGNLTNLRWLHDGAAAEGMLADHPAPELALSFSCTLVRDGRIDEVGDLPVTLISVKANGREALNRCAVFHLTCSAHPGETLPSYAHLLLHSQGAELTISAGIQGDTEPGLNLVFHVTGGEIDLWVAVPANETATIFGLPLGTYKVEAANSWTWRYLLEEGEKTVNLNTARRTVEFTGAVSILDWLTGFARKG